MLKQNDFAHVCAPRTMEYQLTTPKDDFQARFLQKATQPVDMEKEGLAYRRLELEIK